MQTILTVVLVIICLMLVIAVLLQQGKGADAGAAFGSGASGTVFGAGGSATFMSKATAVLATVFFALTLALAYLSGKNGPVATGGSVLDRSAPAIDSEVPTINVPDDELGGDAADGFELDIDDSAELPSSESFEVTIDPSAEQTGGAVPPQ